MERGSLTVHMGNVDDIGVIGKSAVEIGQFLTRNIWMISGDPFLSRSLCFTAEKVPLGTLSEAAKRVLFSPFPLQI